MMLVDRGIVTRTTVVRGPTTRQFWTVARRVPGLAHRLGYCHACDARVDAGDEGCHACGAAFSVYFDRNDLGLPDIRPLPWEEASAAGAGRRQQPAPSDDWMSMGGRLSSFATDEQLFSQSTAHSAATIAAPSPMSVGNGSALETHDDRMPTQATINALQRTVQRQERLVRMLGIVAAIAIGVGCILLVVILMRGGAEAAMKDAGAGSNENANAGADQPAVDTSSVDSKQGDASADINDEASSSRSSSTSDATEIPANDDAMREVVPEGSATPEPIVPAIEDPAADVRALLEKARTDKTVDIAQRQAWLDDAGAMIDAGCTDGTYAAELCAALRAEHGAVFETIELEYFFDG
jgi:hypothetical protein